MNTITNSTLAKAAAIMLLAIFSISFLISALGLVFLSQENVFFDNGVELRYNLYENAVGDVYSNVMFRYLVPKLKGHGDTGADMYFADRYSSKNSNIFFSVTDEDGNLVYENYKESAVQFEKSFHTYKVAVSQGVYRDGLYFLPAEEVTFTGGEAYAKEIVAEVMDKPLLRLETSDSFGEQYADVTLYQSDEEASTVTKQLLFRAGVRETLTAKDKLYYTMWVANLAVEYRFVLVAVCAVSFLVSVILFVFLMCATGHRKGTDDITLNPLDKVPLDLYTVCVVIAMQFLVFAMYMCLSLQGLSILLVCVGAVAVLVAAELILLSLILTFTNRIKYGKWWQSTLIFKILHGLYRLLRGGFRMVRRVTDHLPLVWKAVTAFGVFVLVELVFLAAVERQTFMLWWLIARIVLGFALVFLVIDMKKIRLGSEKIARGDTEYHIDTDGMYGEFKKQAMALNCISEGLQKAVNDRMKSERFKTELITNVSHDLKTPLTSIVNYVDLMKKEDIQPEKAREYLEVLDRQSNRLKKLTLDLLDASKASTGNMPVKAERTDVAVFLSQLSGEYSEKLSAGQLELVLAMSEPRENEGVQILADGNLLLRVFDNLMNNICKYAQSGTRVYVSAELAGEFPKEKVVITFKNISRFPLNISSDELMERFVRGDTSRNTEGSGLGLSIAKSLCELQKGRLDLVVDGDLFKAIVTFDRCYE